MRKSFGKRTAMKRVCTYALHTVALSLTVCAAALLYGCSNELLVAGSDVVNNEAQVYCFNIPVAMGNDIKTRALDFEGESGIDAFFDPWECIYLYNETKGAFASSSDGYLQYFSPSEISADKHRCILEGEMTFYKKNGNNWDAVTIDPTDKYSLFYNITDVDCEDIESNRFSYYFQLSDPSYTSSLDFAEVTGIEFALNGNTMSPGSDIVFSPMQSVFHQTLEFFDLNGDPVTPTGLKSCVITSKNGSIVSDYYPLASGASKYGRCCICAPCMSKKGDVEDIYFAASFNYDKDHVAQGDQLMFNFFDRVTISNFVCVKDAPAGGFRNGKYYHGTAVFYQQPFSITNRTTGTNVIPENGVYSLGEDDWFDVNYSGTAMISGTGVGLLFSGESYILGGIDLHSMEFEDPKDPQSIMYNPSYIKTGTNLAIISDCSVPALSNDNNSHCIIEGMRDAELDIVGGLSGSFVFEGAYEITVVGDINGDIELQGATLYVERGDFTGYCTLTPGSRLIMDGGSIDPSHLSATTGTVVYDDIYDYYFVME